MWLLTINLRCACVPTLKNFNLGLNTSSYSKLETSLYWSCLILKHKFFTQKFCSNLEKISKDQIFCMFDVNLSCKLLISLKINSGTRYFFLTNISFFAHLLQSNVRKTFLEKFSMIKLKVILEKD